MAKRTKAKLTWKEAREAVGAAMAERFFEICKAPEGYGVRVVDGYPDDGTALSVRFEPYDQSAPPVVVRFRFETEAA